MGLFSNLLQIASGGCLLYIGYNFVKLYKDSKDNKK